MTVRGQRVSSGKPPRIPVLTPTTSFGLRATSPVRVHPTITGFSRVTSPPAAANWKPFATICGSSRGRPHMRLDLLACIALLGASPAAAAQEIVKVREGDVRAVARPDDLFALSPGQWHIAKHLREGQ